MDSHVSMASSMSVVPPPCQVPETIRRFSSHRLGVGGGGGTLGDR